MFGSLKRFLQAHPRLFDLAKRFDPRSDAARDFFRAYARAHPKGITFVQIGASDGLLHDPIRPWILRRRWRGILVEPLPDSFARLQRNYRHVRDGRLRFVNAAISASASATSGAPATIPFWTFSEAFLAGVPAGERLWWHQKSSFDKAHVLRCLPAAARTEASLEAVSVPCMTVDQLLAAHGCVAPIDLVVIDAEGHERSILSTLDFARWRPGTVFFESHNLHANKEPLYELLASNGYDVTELGGDAVAQRRSAP